MKMLSSLFSKILSIIFPPHCYGCGKEDISLCSQCLQRCKKSIDTPALYITSVYSFHDPLIKKTIHAIKYFHRKDLIEPLSNEIAKEITKAGIGEEESNVEDSLRESSKATDYKLLATNWTLVPIPMPPIRKYIRGYNQAEAIAQELSKQCSLPLDTKILIRAKSSKRQVTAKTKGERLKNQHNSFKIIGKVQGLHIILVDDVTTTGATLSEARSVLLLAGASDVKAVTIAH
jgi:ComF family protein